jgi:large subunit ribosomal protein L10
VAAAKVVVEFSSRNPKLTIVGGALAGQLMDEAGVRELASLSSLDEMRAKLIGVLLAPATGLARLLQEPAARLARALAAYAEAEGEPAAAEN